MEGDFRVLTGCNDWGIWIGFSVSGVGFFGL